MIRLPPHPRGLKIGLFGGTFDPPHAAHRAACLLAMQRLNLDRVWWLVTPGNPLKDTRGLAPLPSASRRRRRSPNNPRIIVTGVEAEMRTRYTYDTVAHADCTVPRRALRLDHGRRQSAQLPSLAEVARHRRPRCRSPWSTASARASTRPPARAAQALSRFRIPERDAKSLPRRKPPAWVFLHGLKSPLSSTALRALRRK